MVEVIATLVLIGILASTVAPKFISIAEGAKQKAAMAGVAEFNSREKMLWSKMILISNADTLASDESIDQTIFDTMNFELNSGTETDWGFAADGHTAGETTSATLTFKGVDIAISRDPATLELPGKWSLASSGGSTASTFTEDDIATSWWNKWYVSADGTTLYNDTDQSGGGMLLADTEGEDYTVTVDATLADASRGGYGLYYRATADENSKVDGYIFQYDINRNQFLVNTVSNTSAETQIAAVSIPDGFNLYTEHKISVSVVGTQHVITIDGTEVLNFSDDTYSSGSVGLRTWANADAQFSNLKVQ